jgi:hypothetical protein
LKGKNVDDIRILQSVDPEDKKRREILTKALRQTPIPEAELLMNLGLFHSRRSLSRLLLMHELYQRIIPVAGVVMEFGVRWGQNLSFFSHFRGMYEPYNSNRQIIGFDTFSGFPAVDPKDGELLHAGDYSVTKNYAEELAHILSCHESEYPSSHRKKFELVTGNAIETFPAYLTKNPHTIIALAYFDFDLYAPTKACLELVRSRVTKGSVIAFDELNSREFPGETLAVMEVLGLDTYSLRRDPLNPLAAYVVVGE